VDVHANSFLNIIYDPNTNPVVYVLIANLIQSAFTLLLLGNEIKLARFNFNSKLWKK
jgi:hypothetical protein